MKCFLFEIDHQIEQINQRRNGIENGNWEGYSENLAVRKQSLKIAQQELMDLLSKYEIDLSKYPISSVNYQMYKFGIRVFIVRYSNGWEAYAEFNGIFCKRHMPTMKEQFGFIEQRGIQEPENNNEQLTLF